jgi:hypothetical protein
MTKYLLYGYNNGQRHKKEFYGSYNDEESAQRALKCLQYEGVRYDNYCLKDDYHKVFVKNVKAILPFNRVREGLR